MPFDSLTLNPGMPGGPGGPGGQTAGHCIEEKGLSLILIQLWILVHASLKWPGLMGPEHLKTYLQIPIAVRSNSWKTL